jgi:GT2 family glycosyltransferase
MTAASRSRSGRREPAITVVIPTQNNVALLVECLEAVERLDYPASLLEVVVVDNGSTDHTRERIARRFPGVRIEAFDMNTGFAVACNRGADAATGEYVAFLNNDAVPDPQWLNATLAAIEAGPAGTVCSAARIVSRDGTEVEYDGAGSNIFGAGRPHSTWGWPGMPEPASTGSPVLFASGGAMLIERAAFLEAGGFDPEYFAYFEDVDLGWRLWILGRTVVYAPDAVVRHIGGATGRRAGAHRRYTLWESNSLATVFKNYETGNMEKILPAALMLEYKRAFLAAGDAVKPAEYALTAPKDTNRTNVERLPKVSMAHLVAIDRLNSMLPHLMKERSRIQAMRRRSDSEILPMLGRLYTPQFAGREYAEAAAKLAEAAGLFGLTDPIVPPRVLLLAAGDSTGAAKSLAEALASLFSVAVVLPVGEQATTARYSTHIASPGSPMIASLVEGADVVLAFGDGWRAEDIYRAGTAVAAIDQDGGSASFRTFAPKQVDEIVDFCRRRGVT